MDNKKTCAQFGFPRFFNSGTYVLHVMEKLETRKQTCHWYSVVVGQVTMVRAKSDGINASLCERRERIEQLNGTRSLLRKIQVNVPNRNLSGEPEESQV
jgi:hypothetical protein